jgi:threonine dehydrogenase-like Zn-dependent dehydrogenase
VKNPRTGLYSAFAAGALFASSSAFAALTLNVELNPNPVRPSETLIAQLHVDAGAIDTFEYPGPDAPVMLGVQMISSAFQTTAVTAATTATPAEGALTSSITVKDQPIQNGLITVSEITSPEAVWLVIHNQNEDGTMGSMIGFTRVDKGTTKDVLVRIDLNKVTSVLYAMLHHDLGKTFELEPFKIFQKGLSVHGSYTSRRNSFQAVALLQSGQVRTAPLISHRLPLADFPRGLALLEQRSADVRKVMILPNG